jgi:hypothetical protein
MKGRREYGFVAQLLNSELVPKGYLMHLILVGKKTAVRKAPTLK